MKKKMTIEEMIAANVPWEQIKARINELQREQKEKEVAEAAARMNQERQKVESQAAKQRFVSAFLDLMIVEKVIRPEDREEFGEMIAETVDGLVQEMRQTILMEALFGKIFK